MRSLLLCLTALFSALITSRADNRLADGDVFRMTLSGAPREFTQEFELEHTVDEGSVNIPNVGRVRVAGLSASQAAAAIEKRLRDEKIFTNPTVVINIATGQRFIIIGGPVRNPGRVQWAANMTLTMAIAAASGPGEYAEDKVRVKRGTQIQEFSRKAIKKDPSLDPKILPGDFIELQGEF
jgi:polysaccharide export outer membrane protein